MDEHIKDSISRTTRIMTSFTGSGVFVTGGLLVFVAGDLKLGGIVMVLGIGIVNNMALCGIEDKLDAMEKRLKKE